MIEPIATAREGELRKAIITVMAVLISAIAALPAVAYLIGLQSDYSRSTDSSYEFSARAELAGLPP